ncbi:MAG: polyphosphate kinase 1, partial [Steroidobacteraceae bacterium]|nr:polyphosphate kinase 1 [Steroidobacteraceae bacterium]MDW8258780.1 polyphosphate kinase 1 [Gammaproteobacteria bacterium]
FLCISSSNLDEFFEIRVAGLQQKAQLDPNWLSPDGLNAADQLAAIQTRAATLVAAQYRCLQAQLLPELRAAGIHLVGDDTANPDELGWLEEYFERQVEPVLSPLALDPARPFPRIQNKSLNFIVQLRGRDAFGRDTRLAIVQVPRSLPRVILLPRDSAGAIRCALLSWIMQRFMAALFPGLQVLGSYQFRVTRNSDLFIDEEEADDLRRALEGELTQRRYGAAVRLEVSEQCPAELVDFLLREFELDRRDLYRVPVPVNLHRISALYDLAPRPDLKYPTFVPAVPAALQDVVDPFAVLRREDVLLHHPYDSFQPVLDLLRLAARDPQVLAIKQTLYRTGDDSPVVEALVDAAHHGKDVTVVIELRARFDEEANIELSTRLQEAGAHVVYGVVGYKTHAKMLLIVRREEDGLRRYCHLGTGNYHPRTARAYTDYGLLTAEPQIGRDVHEIFLQLTSLAPAPTLQRLLQAPFTLHQTLLQLIEQEAAAARAGKSARIVARMNALVEPSVIMALYAASQAGVRIDLIVRGICCLVPGVPGLSENIRVRSIVGRFLEHARVFWFANGGERELWCSSADWMDRNLFRRIEVAFPVSDPRLRQRLRDDLEELLADNTQAWQMDADGNYRRVTPDGAPPRAAQQRMLERHAAGAIPAPSTAEV